MDLGIGLPSHIPGVTREALLECARRADDHGFSTLGVIDRTVYANYEPLVALAAAAAVTERIRLTTAILISPLHTNTVLLAKQTATIDSLSHGRLVLGLAVGGRADDYEVAAVPVKGRGRRLEEQVTELRRIWAGEVTGMAGAVGPPVVQHGGPPLILGASADASLDRAGRIGDGWIAGGVSPDQFAAMAEQVRAAWSGAGREGSPRLLALGYFSLGPDARANADSYIHDYYAWLGEYADQIAGSVAVDDAMVRGYLQAFEQAGCDELILLPCSIDPDQVDLLAAARG